MRHQGALLKYEMIRGEYRDDGLPIVPADPVRGPEDRGPCTFVGRLDKRVWDGARNIATEVLGMGFHTNHDRSLRWDQRGDPG